MLIAIIPLVVALVGALLYALASNTKVQEIGRILFFCGAFVLTWRLASETLRVGSGSRDPAALRYASASVGLSGPQVWAPRRDLPRRTA